MHIGANLVLRSLAPVVVALASLGAAAQQQDAVLDDPAAARPVATGQCELPAAVLFLHDAGPNHIHAPDQVDLQLDGASMDRAGRGWGQSGAQDRKPADQHRGDGEILGRAAGRRAGLGRAVRADVPVPEVTI